MMQQQQIQQLELEARVCPAAIMKSRNSEEQAKELANINKEQDAGRAHNAQAASQAILEKAMQK